MDYEQRKREAFEHLRAGRAMDALGAFRAAVEYPDDLGTTAHATDALSALARIATELAGADFAKVLYATAEAPDDPQQLYDAAYRLYEAQLYGVAAALLTRARRALPDEPAIVSELAGNLEMLMLNAAAAEVLRGSGAWERDPMCRYLLAFNALMSGDVEEPKQHLPALRELDGDDHQYMVDALGAMVARADALAAVTTLDNRALTAWHAVLNGSVLTHESPHGYDEGMRGRYAYVGDSYALMREGVERLGRALASAERRPSRVVATPDRSSRILARAAATLLGLPFEDWDGASLTDRVVVAYDLAEVEDTDVLEALQDHAPGQVLFAHASSWTDPFPYSPDVTTFLYQVVTCPWAGGAPILDPQGGPTLRADPDDAPEEEIAARIVSATTDHASRTRWDEVGALLEAGLALDEPARIGLGRDNGRRARQRIGSAVPSNRFV